MLIKAFNDVYDSFKTKFYYNIFNKFDNKCSNLNVLEIFCLEVIYSLGKPNISQVTAFMGISQPNTAYRVGSLVKKGYVNKIQSEEDKREFLLEVTDKYDVFLSYKRQYIEGILDKFRAKVSDEEIETFEKILNLLAETINSENTSNHTR